MTDTRNLLLIYSLLKLNRPNLTEGLAFAQTKFPQIETHQETFDALLLEAEGLTLVNPHAKWTEEYVESIFQVLGTRDTLQTLPQTPLSIEAFPQKNRPVEDDELETEEPSAVRSPQQLFLQELKTFRFDNAADFGNALLFLAEAYLWSTPTLRGPGGISTWEYLKSRAAFASCLLEADKDPTYPFLLVCGDLSGIQTFIYDIHSSKAGKSLKGRSFYLQILAETLVDSLLQRTGMNRSQVVSANGGKFYVLLPNTPKIVSTLRNLEQEAATYLFAQHQSRLFVCLDWLPFGIGHEGDNYQISCPEKKYDGGEITILPDLWAQVSHRTSLKKQTKWRSPLSKEPSFFDQVFRGKGLEEEFNGPGRTLCAVTGEPVRIEQELQINKDRPNQDEAYVKPEVWAQIKLGMGLVRQDLLHSHTDQNASPLSEYQLKFDSFGSFFHELIKKDQKEIARGRLTIINPRPNAYLPEMEEDLDLDLEAETLSFARDVLAANKVPGFLFYGGKNQAHRFDLRGDPELLTFEELTQPEVAGGFRKLAILRMDVDNLGNLFTRDHKLQKEYRIFATYSALSRQLDWFFSGYLNHIRDSDTYKDHLNIIYAGGDDLFAVGRWDKVLSFAEEVRKKFKEYVGGNTPGLSAGIAIVDPKFPISRAAEMAGEALDEAKRYHSHPTGNPIQDIPEKNALHLLGVTLSWEEEYPFVQSLSKQLFIWYKAGWLKKGLFNQIFAYYEREKLIQDRSREVARQPDWWWHSAFYLSRLIKGLRSEPEDVQLFLKTLQKALVTGNFPKEGNLLIPGLKRKKARMLELIALAFRLTDYQTRKD